MRSLLRGIAGLAHSRLALAGTEVREELARFALLLIGASAAVSLAALVLGVPPDYRFVTAACLTGAFAAGAALVVAYVREGARELMRLASVGVLAYSIARRLRRAA